MTTIEATCPVCGTVDCTADDFTLNVCDHGPSSFYEFTCPVCEREVRKPAGEYAIELLVAQGVTPNRWSLPPELLEPHAGPVISLDDVLDLRLLLERDDWSTALQRWAS